MDIYDHLFEQGFGLVNLGNHRGLFYSSKKNASGCPMGWLFATPELIKSAQHLRDFVAEYLKVLKES